MAGYKPLRIAGFETGLVQSRENFLLPDDAYPQLQNAYVWRERLKRKKGYELLGRLQRQATVTGNLVGGAFNLISGLSLETTSSIVMGSINIVGGTDGTTYTDPSMNGVLLATGGTGTGGTINYATGDITIAGGGAEAITGTIQYYPGLPVMGIRTRERSNSLNDQTIFFDQKYAYTYNQSTMAFQEFITTPTFTTWNAENADLRAIDFFWSTNWWISSIAVPGYPATPLFTTFDKKLFWVTNNTGKYGANADPIRITDGTTWINFIDFPVVANKNWAQIDVDNYLIQALAILPYRGRLLMFNTWEGEDYTTAINYSNRIRWSNIGSPFIPYVNGTPNTGSWRDDVQGKGGFLDIPTAEDIVSVGFVRDNIVIYCERSTWQLRYTGRSISPFQIEKVNSELGTEGTFSAIQFDTSLVGIGDKGIVECDSYQSNRIDIKIPDFVFGSQDQNSTITTENGLNSGARIQGSRDFVNRLAYWTVCIASSYDPLVSPSDRVYPNQRLVYNYENDSWALFNDSLTALGTYQPQSPRTWKNTHVKWKNANFTWRARSSVVPAILGGNQQGFVEYLNQLTANDVSLYISDITGHEDTDQTTVITCPNHNMQSNFVIEISGIPTGNDFDDLNGQVFGIDVINESSFQIYKYDSEDDDFTEPQLDSASSVYLGGGLIKIRENFSIVSKKFNFLDEGENIQLGYLDILMDSTGASNPGAISMNVYLDYDDINSSNTLPNNVGNPGNLTLVPDNFFNSIIPTTKSTLSTVQGSKFWQRVFCPTRANFLTIQYTFNNAQMAGNEQQLDVQIDAQILWLRKAGRMTTI